MTRGHLLFAAVAIASVSCGRHEAPARRQARSVAPVDLTAVASAAPRTEALYVYSPVGKRDPFQRDVDPRRPLSELQHWPVDQFNLKFTVTGTASPKAVLAAPDTRAWLVGIGDYVGSSWGKITAIEQNRVVVTESIEGPGGTVYLRAIDLVLPPAGSAEPEHHMIDVPPGK